MGQFIKFEFHGSPAFHAGYSFFRSGIRDGGKTCESLCPVAYLDGCTTQRCVGYVAYKGRPKNGNKDRLKNRPKNGTKNGNKNRLKNRLKNRNRKRPDQSYSAAH